MIGLREDQRERVQLVGKINALFGQLRDGLVVVGGLATTSPAHHSNHQAGGWVASIEGR